MDIPVSGHCDARFRAVRDEFVRNFGERGEVGAAVCIVVDGVTVVDLAGGWADPATGAPWRHDTLVDYYSVGKAFVALLALQLVDAGLVALDEPICTVWPEFAAAGKEGATLRHALCHRAGVPAIRAPLRNDDLWDWDRMAGALAATAPWWEPGTRHAYHTNTYGHLIGEVVRRVSGEPCGRRLAALAGPLQADLFVGVPPAEQRRCAEVLFESPGPPAALDEALEGAPEGDARMEMLSYFNPPGYSSMGVVNTAAWRSAEVPSTNGHGTARGVARLYAALLEPGRLLSTRPAGRGDVAAVDRLLPDPPRGRHLRARFQTHGAASSLRSQPGQLRPLRHRGSGGLRRSGGRGGVRVRHEPCHPPLAEHAQPFVDRRVVPISLTRLRDGRRRVTTGCVLSAGDVGDITAAPVPML